MARRSLEQMSIAQIERMLESRRSQLNEKEKERRRLQQQLQRVEEDIRRLGGTVGGGGGAGGRGGNGRARNEKSLVATLEHILKTNGKPMKVGDIADACTKCGYRSNSANFRAIVNQT